jgi:hypothetical protein
MKHSLLAALLAVATIAACASAQANPPVTLAQAPPPGVPAQKDGPFRLLLAARADARHRRIQGFHADVVSENGMWWVIYYP